MTDHERTSHYWSRRVSRRGVIRGVALGGAGLAGAALIGCGGDDVTFTDSPQTGDVTATPG
ncbi:MAG: hypothetical protein Q8M79_12315, partial [Dehalococcoidia bacterium]|nr:hypothetical protein [Dehalococcoidia bacterium]MDP2328853.1 hypothetical protein [Dehalococcoidia bacterium]